MSISEKITNLRKEKNLSQEAFAEALGVSRQSVSKWESGAALPDTDKIIAMSELFGVSTDYLLKDDAVSTEPVAYIQPENPPVQSQETERNDEMFNKKKKKAIPCPHCHKPGNDDDAEFCKYCGKRLDEDGESPAEEEPIITMDGEIK